MLEKLKDFFYETSDLLLALVILLIMSSVITWQVSDSMAFNKDESTDTPASVEIPASEDSELDEIPAADIDEEKPEGDDTSMDSNEDLTEDMAITDENEGSQSVEAPETNEAEGEDPSPTEGDTIETASNDVTVTIPSGTSGAGIAKILKDNNLIQDTAAFISRIEELNLAAKLKSGTFTINSNTSLDDMIYIITGQKR